MDAKPYTLQAPESIATKFGGNKQKIAQAAQMGMIDPTAAVMAGMFIDRMRAAQMAEQAPPQQTVAQQVLAPPQAAPQGMPPQGGPPQEGPPQGGLGALAGGEGGGAGGVPPELAAMMAQQGQPQGGPPQGMPPMGPPPEAPPMGMAGGGLLDLPVPDDMYDSYATGGLVAFGDGGEVEHYPTGGLIGKPWNFKGTAEEYQAAVEASNAAGDARKAKSPGRWKAAGEFFNQTIPNLMGADAQMSVYDRMGVDGAKPFVAPPPAAPAAVDKAAAVAATPVPVGGLANTPVAQKTAADVGINLGAANKPAAPRTSAPAGGRSSSGSGSSKTTLETRVAEKTAALVGPEAASVVAPTRKNERAVDLLSSQSLDETMAFVRAKLNYDTTEEDALKAELKATPEKMKARKKEDIWATIAEIGFAMAGSNSPYAMQAIGQAGTAALPGMMQRTKDRRAEEKDARKELVSLEDKANARRLAELNGAQNIITAKVSALGADLTREESKRATDMQAIIEREKMALTKSENALDRATEITKANISAAASRSAGGSGKVSDYQSDVRDVAALLIARDGMDPVLAQAQAAANVRDRIRRDAEAVRRAGGSKPFELPGLGSGGLGGGNYGNWSGLQEIPGG